MPRRLIRGALLHPPLLLLGPVPRSEATYKTSALSAIPIETADNVSKQDNARPLQPCIETTTIVILSAARGVIFSSTAWVMFVREKMGTIV